MTSQLAKQHNKNAPYWAGAMIIFCLLGISTTWIDLGFFWKGYVLDICGPAWNYILFRALFTSYTKNKWTNFFSPGRTYLLFVIVLFGIEAAQYFKLYDATYDPFDLLSYVSLLTPLMLLDKWQFKKGSQSISEGK